MIIRSLRTVFTVVLWAGLGSSLFGAALDYSLSFTTLPSAQGWTYESPYSNLPESTYIATGTSLIENGVGIGLGPYSGFSWYSYTPTNYNATLPWELNFDVAITDDEYYGPLYRQGFANYIFLGGWGYGFGIDRNNINLYNGTNYSVNVGTGSNRYTFAGDPVSHQYQIRMNGSLIASGTMVAGSDQFLLGDVTNNHNADATLTFWHITQVPEPATWMLLGGATLLAGFRRQRAQS